MKKIITKLKSIVMDQTTPEQFIKYIMTGSISFIAEMTILYICKDWFNLWYIYSNSIAIFIIFWLNFLMNRFWTFKSKTDFGKQIGRYGVLFVFNLVASNTIMFLLTDWFQFYYLFSKIMAVAVEVTWNFVLYKKVIYK